MRHHSELELLDEVYLPGQSEMTAHLAECASCRSRVERLRSELGSIRDGFERRVESKPEAFWEQQRASVMARVRRPAEPAFLRPLGAWALAAMLVIAVGGGWILRDRGADPLENAPAATTSAAPVAVEPPVDAVQLPTADPWAAEELAGWEEAVDWESWLEPGDLERGDAS
ncbi:MAG TPA: hypothetical protein VLV48_10255 [Thermoanaerobaculia bacterium]|nr:hypothetical protein [Thermoanaerobaculia bacterium]